MGKYVRLTHYIDDNLFHDQLTCHYVMVIFNLANKNPVNWYSKKQNTMETCKYGSEFFYPYLCGADY